MRVVDPKNRYTGLNPKKNDPLNLAVEALGIVIKVQRVNVLIFLGWIFRIGDASVGSMSKPLWVTRYPWVIRSRLKRQIQGDFQI